MSQSKLMLSRAQLEAFLGKKDPDAIRAFERLFAAGDLVESGFGVPRGHIDGFTLSNAADADHDITIAAGEATDSTGVMMLSSDATITKRIDAPWSEGDGAGGLDTGVVAANSVYYMWRIYKATDKSLDAVFSLSKTAPTLAAVYTHMRRIGTVVTDASANIIPGKWADDLFTFNQPVQNRVIQTNISSTNRTAFSTSAPPDVLGVIRLIFNQGTSNASYYMWWGSADRPDVAASSSNVDGWMYAQDVPQSVIATIKLNGSSQFFFRGSSTAIRLGYSTLGWIDDRGRDAA